MSDICVAYWSGTGNTEAMAQAIGAGITAAGKSADVVPMETISPADLKDISMEVQNFHMNLEFSSDIHLQM